MTGPAECFRCAQARAFWADDDIEPEMCAACRECAIERDPVMADVFEWIDEDERLHGREVGT